jgi:hypothetical protein
MAENQPGRVHTGPAAEIEGGRGAKDFAGSKEEPA